MRAKEYLKNLQRLDTVINQKIAELGDLRCTLRTVSGIDYAKDRVQTSPSGEASFSKIMIHLIDLEAEINQEIDNFVDQKHEIINQIQTLSVTDHIALLYKRYIEYKSLEVIAVEMNFTYQYTRELHGHALQDFERTYTNLH